MRQWTNHAAHLMGKEHRAGQPKSGGRRDAHTGLHTSGTSSQKSVKSSVLPIFYPYNSARQKAKSACFHPSTLSFFQGSSSEAPTRWGVGPSDRASLARWLSFVGVRAAAAPQMTPHRRDGQQRTGTTCYSDQCVGTGVVGNRRDQQRSVVTVEVPAGGQTAQRYRCDRQWNSFRLGGFACVQKSTHAARSLICSAEGGQDRNDTSCV
jgi:hypothetical protein